SRCRYAAGGLACGGHRDAARLAHWQGQAVLQDRRHRRPRHGNVGRGAGAEREVGYHPARSDLGLGLGHRLGAASAAAMEIPGLEVKKRRRNRVFDRYGNELDDDDAASREMAPAIWCLTARPSGSRCGFGTRSAQGPWYDQAAQGAPNRGPPDLVRPTGSHREANQAGRLSAALNTSNTQPKEEKDVYRVSTTHPDPYGRPLRWSSGEAWEYLVLSVAPETFTRLAPGIATDQLPQFTNVAD